MESSFINISIKIKIQFSMAGFFPSSTCKHLDVKRTLQIRTIRIQKILHVNVDNLNAISSFS